MNFTVRMYWQHDLDLIALSMHPDFSMSKWMKKAVIAFARGDTEFSIPVPPPPAMPLVINNCTVHFYLNDVKDADVIDKIRDIRSGFRNSAIRNIFRFYMERVNLEPYFNTKNFIALTRKKETKNISGLSSPQLVRTAKKDAPVYQQTVPVPPATPDPSRRKPEQNLDPSGTYAPPHEPARPGVSYEQVPERPDPSRYTYPQGHSAADGYADHYGAQRQMPDRPDPAIPYDGYMDPARQPQGYDPRMRPERSPYQDPYYVERPAAGYPNAAHTGQGAPPYPSYSGHSNYRTPEPTGMDQGSYRNAPATPVQQQPLAPSGIDQADYRGVSETQLRQQPTAPPDMAAGQLPPEYTESGFGMYSQAPASSPDPVPAAVSDTDEDDGFDLFGAVTDIMEGR